jgi:integrative and conjugative element protein (TIGR02256 family)
LSLRYVLEQGGSAVVLTDEVLVTMNRYRQTGQNDKEAGGQLFAQFEGSDAIIVEATPPKWCDRRSRHHFQPNRWFQQQDIRKRYAQGLHFVGDWHTHPEPVPHPSKEDLCNMQECFKSSLHDLHAFIMIIVGYAQVPDGLHVALIEQNAVRLMTCENS